MASRYWVPGGSGNWSTAAGPFGDWASSSGGTGNQLTPTINDDVFFDANSGSGSVNVNNASCRSLTTTGFTGTFVGPFGVRVATNAILGAGMTWGTGQGVGERGPGLTFTGASSTLTTNGVTFILDDSTSQGVGVTSGGTLTLQDDLTVVGAILCTNGIFNAGTRNVTCQFVRCDGSNPRTLNMGSGIWKLTGTGTIWNPNGSSFSVNMGTSTIQIENSSSSSATFAGNGLTYNDLRVLGNGAGDVIITGSNTFDELRIDPRSSGDRRVLFGTGSVQTMTSFLATGTASATIGLRSGSDGTQFSFVQASGTVDCDFLTIRDSIAGGGATWNAGENSTNLGNNSGWVFSGGGGGGVDSSGLLMILSQAGLVGLAAAPAAANLIGSPMIGHNGGPPLDDLPLAA